MNSSEIIKEWPEESREAAQLVIDAHGEADEATATMLTWFNISGCSRVIASKTFFPHDFPIPHTDSVESVIDYRVPVDKFTALAEFDGSVVAERTAGEVSARCHDEQANFLALNLMHDIVTNQKTPEEARAYYGKEFLDYRRKKPTPYMQQLHFEPDRHSADPDERILTGAQLEEAAREGEQTQKQNKA